MKKIIVITALTCFSWLGLSAQDFPQAEISNQVMKAKLYLPDINKGYYQGARFDWSGVIPVLEYKGHSYFAQWFNNYNPTTHDAILGPVEEFFELGYDKAKVGEEFIRIGIGGFKKPEEKSFNRFGYYVQNCAAPTAVYIGNGFFVRIVQRNGNTIRHALG